MYKLFHSLDFILVAVELEFASRVFKQRQKSGLRKRCTIFFNRKPYRQERFQGFQPILESPLCDIFFYLGSRLRTILGRRLMPRRW